MTRPLKLTQDQRETWLHRYLRVQRRYDKEVNQALRDASEDIAKRIEDLEGKSNIGAKVRRVQLLGANGMVTQGLHSLYENVLTITRHGQDDAAGAAAKAFIADSEQILEELIPDEYQRRVFEKSFRQSSMRGVQAMVTRILETELPLSERVWRSEAFARGQLSRVINSSLAAGDGPAELAKRVRYYVSPTAPGGVSYAARRLARTEINNAFHAQSISQAEDAPWVVEMQWRLSSSHVPTKGDECEAYAMQGTFDKDKVPRKPHPNCLCTVIPVMESDDEFFETLMSGGYDAWINRNS